MTPEFCGFGAGCSVSSQGVPARHEASSSDAPDARATVRAVAVLDFACGFVDRRPRESEWMVLTVGPDGVSLGMNALDEIGISSRHLPDHEEGHLDAFGGENVEHAAGIGGNGPSSKVKTTS